MDLLQQLQNRRSVRTYTAAPVPEAHLQAILQAGLLSASGRARRPWEFILVTEKDMLQELTRCREGAANMLAGASAAVVVVADPDLTDVWTEDCSIAMANMHLMADSLGVGSCWIQGCLRKAADGSSTEDFLRGLLHFPEHFRLEAILSLGMPETHPEPHTLDSLPYEKIHRETW